MKNNSLNPVPKNIIIAAWAIALGAITPMLDSTMVNIAVKDLTASFHTTLDWVQWGITGYLLALAMAVPISGWLMNQFNSKYVFISAVVGFGITSFITGLSWNISVFIAFRLIQGFSAGIITTLMSTMLIKIAGEAYIGRVIAIVSTPMILGPIFGPVIGGFIVHASSWRWIFFINVLITLIAVPIMVRTLPHFCPFNKMKSLDIVGMLHLCLISITMIYGLTQATKYASFVNNTTLTSMIIGILLIVSYIIYNRRNQYNTVLPTNLFKHRNFGASSSGLFLSNIAILGPMIILPLFFQDFFHFTSISAALMLMPQGVGMLITRPLIGKLTDQYGPKVIVLVSAFFVLISTIPFISVSSHSSIIWIELALFLRGCFVGGVMLPLTSGAYLGLKNEQLTEAGVGINIIENLGSSFGGALIATIVATFINTLPTTAHNILVGYHAGFLVSMLAIICLFLPASFLNKKISTMQ
ncbi:DHA2 family efflux MFS transporter permease subunit [Staphylococcus edaphicus]|uniref:Quinolone resistance protein NorB n=1 Tax=Staphylococcus edaphicus TaxID=1955013 RepID=A0A2C6WQ37_9STAP|nr:DHA2 family efflux MFS transporter permease subunit [Staphylococcus edaphicus]PHK50499.1 MFS transporter [Staphylococcus edaphicus]UQW81185.1 DHA2 family efflux MFS transporter permease subunit [Staphylococcus edaphicus]